MPRYNDDDSDKSQLPYDAGEDETFAEWEAMRSSRRALWPWVVGGLALLITVLAVM